MRLSEINTNRWEGYRLAVRAAENIISTCSPVHPFAAYAALSLKGKQGVTGLAFCVTSAACRRAIASFLRKEVAPKGETTHYDLRVAIAPSNHVRCARRRRRRIGASGLSLKRFGPILRASPSSFLRKEPYVTGFTFVSPVLHDEEPEPPSTGRGAPSGDGG